MQVEKKCVTAQNGNCLYYRHNYHKKYITLINYKIT